MVSSEDAVSPHLQHGDLLYLFPRLQVTETVPLLEVAHQVNYYKLRQHVSENLAAWVLGLIQVHVEVSHQYRVLEPEFFKASSRSGRWDSMVGWRYDPMTGVLDVPLMTSQLTTFVLWKCVDLRLHPVRRTRETSTTHLCSLPSLAGWAV